MSLLFAPINSLDRFAAARLKAAGINYQFLPRHFDRIGDCGWIACEYNPLGDTVEGLACAKPFL